MANVKEEVKNEAKIAEAAEEVVRQSTKAMEATEALAAADETEETEEQEIQLPKIYVVRRSYISKTSGKKQWEYILPAVFRGSVSEVHFKAADIGGYEALDKLFSDGVKKIELQVREEKQYDEKTGWRRYFVYEVVYKDNIGFEWRYPLKTVRQSDKAVMENYIRLLRFEAEQTAKAAK